MMLKKCLLTANDCFKKGTKIANGKPKGIIVHSTGANNTQIRRYVQPLKSDKEYENIIKDIGINANGNHWNKSGVSKCVHAFCGKTINGEIAIYQTLPFDYCCWGCGSGTKGSYNGNPNAYIQFEICEDALDDEKYFNQVFREAAKFCGYLCKEYDISPDLICSHKEAHRKGYASNHGDPEHWLMKFGKSMKDFRNMVKEDVQVEIKRDSQIKKGTLVKISSNATYYTGKKIPDWVINKLWYVKQDSVGERAIIDESEDGENAICSPINIKYLISVKSENKQKYRIKVKTPVLNVRSGPGINHGIVKQLRNGEIYEIIEEQEGLGASLWGNLVDGWVSLDYCEKI